MFKNWFAQGIITNIAWTLGIALGGVVVAVLARYASPWATPTLYGLGASATLAVIVGAARFGFLKPKRTTVRPGNASSVVRDWLDKANIAVQNTPLDGWVFNYTATIDGRKIFIGQEGKNRAYLTVSTNLTFTDDDNRSFAATQGGIDGIVRALRIALSAAKVLYSGIDNPLKQIIITKRVFISDGLLEHELDAVILEVEAAFNVMAAIVWLPPSVPTAQRPTT